MTTLTGAAYCAGPGYTDPCCPNASDVSICGDVPTMNLATASNDVTVTKFLQHEVGHHLEQVADDISVTKFRAGENDISVTKFLDQAEDDIAVTKYLAQKNDITVTKFLENIQGDLGSAKFLAQQNGDLAVTKYLQQA